MSKKSDDSIERIFRQALTQYDTKFHEGDWLKMEQLLKEEAQRKAAARSKRFKGTAYTLTGLTGLIIAVYFLAIKNPSGSIAGLNDSVTEMQASEALTEKGNVKHENPSEDLLSESFNGSKESEKNNNSALSEENDSDRTVVGEKNQVNENLDEREDSRDAQPTLRDDVETNNSNTSGLRNPALSSNDRQTESEKSLFQMQPDEPGLDLTRSPSKESIPSLTPPVTAENVEAVDDKSSKGDDGMQMKNPSAISGESGKGTSGNAENASVPVASEFQTSSATGSQKEQVSVGVDSSFIVKDISHAKSTDSSFVDKEGNPDLPKVAPFSRWSVAFIIAPEFSTTSLNSYSSPGESLGLRIAYQLSNKFSINTGVIRSTKKYEGSGDDYKPRNPAYWQIRTNGVVPEEIYSKCLIYELPVGVQFDAINTSKSRLFVSTAISSYLMISQAYDYTFESPNPGADTGWRSPGSESYWLSVGMVSAGYERYINRSFAIGIEPYLKISLSEIGWPNVKLFSTGAYVTLRYKFMSRRNF
jgi:hypothetical protein